MNYIITMKLLHPIKILSLIASLALFSACDDASSSINIPNENCSNNSKITGFLNDFGGYKNDKYIPFMHSDGYNFKFLVTDRVRTTDELCKRHLYTKLVSDYPIYTIGLDANADNYTYVINGQSSPPDDGFISVTFGQYVFTVYPPSYVKDSLYRLYGKKNLDASFIDTMEINGVTYTDVFVSEGRKHVLPHKTNAEDKFVDSDAKLYYQAKKGILKIEMEDGSFIAINEEDD